MLEDSGFNLEMMGSVRLLMSRKIPSSVRNKCMFSEEQVLLPEQALRGR